MNYPALESLAVLMQLAIAAQKHGERILTRSWLRDEFARLSAMLESCPCGVGTALPGLYEDLRSLGVGYAHFCAACKIEWFDNRNADEKAWEHVEAVFAELGQGEPDVSLPLATAQKACVSLAVRLRPTD